MIIERNPNNQTSSRLRDEQDMYAKLLTMLLWKYRDVLPSDVVITQSDIEAQIAAFNGTLGNIVVDDSQGRIRLSVVDDAEGRRLARKAGGLPT